MNYGTFSPAVSAAFNTGCVAGATVLTGSCTAASGYWLSTTDAVATALARYVDFDDGQVFSNNKNDTEFVRAVRGFDSFPPLRGPG